MKIYDWNGAERITKEALDKIDIQAYLVPGVEIIDVIDAIEKQIKFIAATENTTNWEDYMQDYQNAYNFMKQHTDIFTDSATEIFNCMTDDEFLIYLRNRYPYIRWGCEYIERIYVI
jgi:2-methylisocitrate lyase-like PEP mutase family enzyme